MDGTGREPRPASWTARILAPVLLVVVFAAIVLVVTGSLSSDDGDSDNEPERKAAVSGCSDEARQAFKQGYYVVEADDISGLSGIADKTCTTVDRLVELNPNLDPQALQVQNCVDLVPDGCKKLAG